MVYLGLVLIPSTFEESELVIDGREEKMVKKPYMVPIVDIKIIMEFKKCEIITPCCTNLSSNINPEPFSVGIMDASKLYISKRPQELARLNNYVPAPNI